ncbi:MAG: DNA gyrase inhibitor YacG [Lactobacillales bacterium]|jgi:endogenous inhibitor of DNA gyrase (YacG/DUF329 family)|nr:DNA gyrase inhibitor YacG [Lactobacillales bacterium]
MKTTPILHAKCPICAKTSILEYKPFCSKKCADVDLGRWLKGTYVVHTDEKPTNENQDNNVDSSDID